MSGQHETFYRPRNEDIETLERKNTRVAIPFRAANPAFQDERHAAVSRDLLLSVGHSSNSTLGNQTVCQVLACVVGFPSDLGMCMVVKA